MTPPAVIAMHRSLHLADGAVIVRPDICDECRGAVVAARRRGLLGVDELRPGHPPPTYAELRTRLGTPLRPSS
jgi:hypothetical protein